MEIATAIDFTSENTLINAASSSCASRRILLVEDDVDIASLLTVHLE